MVRLVLLIALTLTAGGCGYAERPAKAGDPLRFEFQLLAGENEIDQTLTIENPGSASLAVEYADPPEGESQQWVRVTEIAPLTSLAAGGKKTIRLPAELRWRVIGSVKPYFSR